MIFLQVSSFLPSPRNIPVAMLPLSANKGVNVCMHGMLQGTAVSYTVCPRLMLSVPEIHSGSTATLTRIERVLTANKRLTRDIHGHLLSAWPDLRLTVICHHRKMFALACCLLAFVAIDKWHYLLQPLQFKNLLCPSRSVPDHCSVLLLKGELKVLWMLSIPCVQSLREHPQTRKRPGGVAWWLRYGEK